MIIVKLSGGLGNQMFQYAAGIALAISNKCELKLDLSWFDMFDSQNNNESAQKDPDKISQNVTPRQYELDHFNISVAKANKSEVSHLLGHNSLWLKFFRKIAGINNSHYFCEKNFHFNSDFLNLKGSFFIDGYWQSEKYFSAIVNKIRADFLFNNFVSEENKDIARRIVSLNAISLHVRRNDLVKNPNLNSIHGVCSLGYYQKAILYIAARVERPYFFVFSDDATWVKENLIINSPFEIMDHNQGRESFNDMHLMTLCKHNIIANSTFSWWGAWLNSNQEKVVIAPQKWLINTDTVSDYKQFMDDLIPSNWVRL